MSEAKRKEADRQADRLMAMLDASLDAIRNGRFDDAVMIMETAEKTASAIPKKDDAK